MDKLLKDLQARREAVVAGGGPAAIQKQHEKGKYTARERLERLFDPGSFVELDMFVEHRATELGMAGRFVPDDAVICGYGTMNGRTVYAFAQDFTVMGGTLGEMHAMKIAKTMDLAASTGAPFIGINDSGGARIQEGVNALNGFGSIFYRNTLSSGVIPQISVIMGPCAGGAVYSPALTDFVFMVNGTSQMFITGPDVIKAVTGEEVSFEELGGARTHNEVSGVAHFFAENEDQCFAQIKSLLDYLPSNNLEDPPWRDTGDPIERTSPGLRSLVPEDPNRAYDMLALVSEVMDAGSIFEVHAGYARNIITAFARLEGRVVGVIANQPHVLAGCLDIDASDKAARFIRFCDAFNIPLVTFVDTPGYLPGTAQEYGGIIRHGAKLLYAYAEATVPKIQVIVRKAYGGAYIAMCSRSLGADVSVAWPTAEIAVMGPEGAANIIFRNEINAAEDPAAVRQEKIVQYRERFANPYVAASHGYVDMVIDPADTRPTLGRLMRAIATKRESRPAKKHGNIPL